VSELRFTFTCQRCGSPLEGRSSISKQLGRCPTCAAVFVVPDIDPRTGLPSGPAEVADDGELPTPMHAYAAAGEKAPRIRRLESGDLTIDCPRCGGSADVEAHLCPRCGLPFTIEGATTAAAVMPQSGQTWPHACLALGVLSLLTIFCVPVPILGLLTLCVGFASARRARRAGLSEPASATAARTTGIVLACFSILIFVVIYALKP